MFGFRKVVDCIQENCHFLVLKWATTYKLCVTYTRISKLCIPVEILNMLVIIINLNNVFD